MLFALAIFALQVGSTPLHDAVWSGQIETVRRLISEGANVNARHPEAGPSVEMLRLLLDAGADPVLPGPDGVIPLDNAVRNRRYEAVAVLLDHARDRPARATEMLEAAVKRNDPTLVGILVEHGADFNGRNSVGATPLHEAALKGYTEIVAVLLAHGADPNARETESGNTPLYNAAAMGHEDVVKLLLDRGADPATRKSKK